MMAQGLLRMLLLLALLATSIIDPCFGEDDTEDVSSLSVPLPAIPSPEEVVVNMDSYGRRSDRFPSVETRVKLYMSNWYTPPCENNLDAVIRYKLKKDGSVWPKLQVKGLKNHPLVNQTTRVMTLESIVEPDMVFFMDEKVIVNCANYSHDEDWAKKTKDPVSKRVKFRLNMRMYCQDVQDLLLPAWYHVQLKQEPGNNNRENNHPPILLQFGDNKQSHVFKDVQVPHIKKFRSAAVTPQDLEQVTTISEACDSGHRKALQSMHGNHRLQPIVWKLATDRHYKKLYEVYREDTVWSKKKNMAVFRGQLTGSRDGYDKNLSDMENCHNLKRCRLVYNHANSTLIHARLTSTRGRLPSVLNGVELEGEKVRINTLLEYKGIIMIEGNDVASGLKWALLSQSIVLMPPPKHTSWAMEELLQPWVHYVPLDEFATNVEERMQWVVDHDEEAQRISERATLWMEDLVFHPDAAEDDRLIQEEILRRYQRHFVAEE